MQKRERTSTEPWSRIIVISELAMRESVSGEDSVQRAVVVVQIQIWLFPYQFGLVVMYSFSGSSSRFKPRHGWWLAQAQHEMDWRGQIGTSERA